MYPELSSVEISGTLLLAVKIGDSTVTIEKALSSIPVSELVRQLNRDDLKKTFWINIYNAFFQILSVRYKIQKPAIFRDKLIEIAGNKFSLDDIEHGILRRYRYKYSLGYFANPFAPALIKKLAVSIIDWRIHFALNCGAKSCPPIAFYKADLIDRQLELAAKSFLENETEIDNGKRTLTITPLFKWFKADFGGSNGIKNILHKYLSQQISGYKIIYSLYDWSTDLHNFSE